MSLSGKKFNKLTVIRRVENPKGSHIKYLCKCDCGNYVVHFGSNIIQGNVKACGCVLKKHGKYNTREHRSWINMRQRCRNKRLKKYQSYGARGISICERWDDFNNFFADMGVCPDGKSIDRIDNNGNYEPSNCRWATPKEQMQNTRLNKLKYPNGYAKRR